MAVERIRAAYGEQDILVSTNERYLEILREQLPSIPEQNFISEPARRDLAAAVGLAMLHANRKFGAEETVAIVWGDNYMTNSESFLQMMSGAEKLLQAGEANIVFMGETARFANNNLGWIGLGEQLGDINKQKYFEFSSWAYRPSHEECRRMFEAGNFVWNTGYFVTRPRFILEAYQRFQPTMWTLLEEIGESIGHDVYPRKLRQIYPKIESASFDDAIVKNINSEHGVVMHAEMGWSDPGTLYALKESINPDPQANVSRGLVKSIQTRDSLLFNYEQDKLLAVAGLDGMVVVNTRDALLVVHKDDVQLVKQLVNELADSDLERYS